MSSIGSGDLEEEDEEVAEIWMKPAWQRGNRPTYIVVFCVFIIACVYATVIYFGVTMPGPEGEGRAGRRWRKFLYPYRVSRKLRLEIISNNWLLSLPPPPLQRKI